jgi:LysR family transcriptional regulator, transcriptional activator AphB
MKNDYSLDDLRLFWVVARLGSFTKAAEHLTMPVSTLSRRIAQLEGRLAIRLLHRDAHRLNLTEIGQRYLERCDPLFQELNAISGELHDELHVPRGRLRIAAPITIAQQWLGAALSRFLLLYPHIQLDVTLSNNNIDLMDSGIDLAVRAGEQYTQEWIARPLGQVAMMLCAERQLAEVLDLTQPEQLDSAPLVQSRPIRVWRLQHPESGQTRECRPSANIRLAVDDMATAAHAVASGLGVGLLPRFLMAPWLGSGAVVPVLAPWEGQPRPLYLLYRDRGQQPLRLRLLIDFLQVEAHAWQPSIIEV